MKKVLLIVLSLICINSVIFAGGSTAGGVTANSMYSQSMIVSGNVGIKNNSPSFSLDIDSTATVITINNVISAPAEQIPGTESLDAAFFNDGGSYQIIVWAYKEVGNKIVYSSTPCTINFTDDGESDEWFYINWKWASVAGATGYKIKYVTQWNGTFNVYMLPATTELNDVVTWSDAWYLSSPPYSYTNSLITPSSPSTVHFSDSFNINGNGYMSGDFSIANGDLSVGGAITAVDLSVDNGISLGTTANTGTITIKSQQGVAGLYVDATNSASGGAGIRINTLDGTDFLSVDINGTNKNSLIGYADSTIELTGGSNGSIYFSGDSSVSAPGDFFTEANITANRLITPTINSSTVTLDILSDVNVSGNVVANDFIDLNMAYASIGVSYNATALNLTQNVYATYNIGIIEKVTKNVTVSTSDGTIQVLNPGLYEILAFITFTRQTGGNDIHGGISINGATPDGDNEFSSDFNATEAVSVSCGALKQLNANDTICLKFENVSASNTITVKHMKVIVKRISP